MHRKSWNDVPCLDWHTITDEYKNIPDKANDMTQMIIGGSHMISSPAVDGWIDAEQPKSLTRSNRRSCTIKSTMELMSDRSHIIGKTYALSCKIWEGYNKRGDQRGHGFVCFVGLRKSSGSRLLALGFVRCKGMLLEVQLLRLAEVS